MPFFLIAAVIALTAWGHPAVAERHQPTEVLQRCSVEVHVLGIAQDAGIPQIGQSNDPAWAADRNLQPGLAQLATSLALIDRAEGKRYLFEATPDLRQQLQQLDRHAPAKSFGLGIDGVFLSHAHIGHYAGLMFLGRESADTRDVPVYAMPRLHAFLEQNGPWDQLVRLHNIDVRPMADGEVVRLSKALSVTPHIVPHRDEYSETVGFSIKGPTRSALFIPDIDGWDRWKQEFDQRIEDAITEHDIAFLDATVYDNNELPGRDMSAIPHPRIVAMMDRFDALPLAQRKKVRFIHLNHSNPARFDDSPASIAIRERGYRVAREGETFCLGAANGGPTTENDASPAKSKSGNP